MFRTGNRIDVSIRCTLNQALSNGSAIFGGLPIPKDPQAFFILCASNNGIKYPIEFSLSGTISTRWLAAYYPQSGATGNGSVITGSFSYIAAN